MSDVRTSTAAPRTGRFAGLGTSVLARARANVGIVVVTLAALTFYLVHALVEQARYLTTGYDLGIFDQAVRAYSHLRAPMVPLKGSGQNIFGDHFHPILVLCAPLYWIWNSPNMLLIAQALLTAAAIPIVYRFALLRAGRGWSLTLATCFAFGWAVQAMIDFDFHEIAFATPLLALAIYALERHNDRQLLICAGLLLLVREDMGLLVVLLALLLLIQRRGAYRLAILMAAVGLTAYVIATSFVIPHFAVNGTYQYNSQFGALGHSVPQVGVNVVAHPLHAVRLFFTPSDKTKTLLLLLVPFGFISLRSRYSLLAAPLLAERFFNTRHNLWVPAFHYNALPWLIFAMAAVDGGYRIGLFTSARRPRMARRALTALMIAAPLVLIVLGPRLGVLSVVKYRTNSYATPASWTRNAEAVVAYLPTNVCVVADNHVAPHLTTRDWTTVAEANTPDPDFVVLDMSARDTGGNPPAPKPLPVLSAVENAGYAIVYRAGTFIVLRAQDYAGPSQACHPLGAGKSGTPLVLSNAP